MNEPFDLKKVFEFEFSHFDLCLNFQLRKTFIPNEMRIGS